MTQRMMTQRMHHSTASFLVLLVGLLLPALCGSAPADKSDWLPKANKQLQNWQTIFEQWQQTLPQTEVINQRQIEVAQLRQKAEACVQRQERRLKALNDKIQALGVQRADEPKDVKQLRKTTSRDKELLENRTTLCRLVALNSQELQIGLKAMRADIIAATLWHKEATTWSLLTDLPDSNFWLKTRTDQTFIWWPSLLVSLMIFLVFYPLAAYLSRFIQKHYPQAETQESPAAGTLFFNMLARRLPWIIGLVSLASLAYLGGYKLVGAALSALLLSLAVAPLLEVLLCRYSDRCHGGLPARVLLDLALIGLSLHIANIDTSLTPEAFHALYSSYMLLIMVFSMWLIHALSKRQALQGLRVLHIPLFAALAVGPVALWMGYRSLADWLISGVYGTVAGLLTTGVLYYLINSLFTQLSIESPSSNDALRKLLGYKPGESIKGLWLGRLISLIAATMLLAYWLPITWGVSKAEIAMAATYITDGFSIGAITIVPTKLLAAALVFFLLLTFARWLRNQLSERWLEHTHLDSGAQQLVVALTTYSIVIAAILLALGMAGVELQNLAIVAGALSVGIGFGLQNIVNNFVSGLILLFERPVKPGDWIIVGNTEGYVKKVSIRYTQIQTFDRADVLVPNSELISNQVTNWMLRDNMGRVVVPVGVAYGSNTEQVAEILNRIAREHPFILVNDPRVPAPRVLMINFGASSLDFELRCFIKDIDYRGSVRSDLLLAINRAFQEANIDIPYPQHVVHMADDSPLSQEEAPSSKC